MNPSDLRREDILMYLRTPDLDENLSQMLTECTEEICRAALPRSVYRVLPVTHDAEGVSVGGLRLLGSDIALHLSGCENAVLFAVTLSAPVDACIRRAQCCDMTRALMLDAAAGAAVEQLCEELTAEIKLKYPYPYYTERFSAGYGDFPITQQPALIQLLDASRKIGLTATPHCTLLPMKSVTALIGLSRQPVKDARRFCCGNSCEECPYHENCSMKG